MRTLQHTFLYASLVAALSGCCTGGTTESTAPVDPAVVPPGTAPAAPAGALVIGGPRVDVAVPALPGFALTIPAAGEFQIDATAVTNDAQLYLFQNGSVLLQDSDSGDGVNARIVAFLAPGSYEVHVGEWQNRDLDAQVSVTPLAPMTPVASLAPGAPPALVQVPVGDSPRAGSVEIALTIAAPGNYRIDATTADTSLDAELMLIQAGALLQSDSDSGDGTNAQIIRQLAPGAYTLRVRDWINRAGAITVSVTPS